MLALHLLWKNMAMTDTYWTVHSQGPELLRVHSCRHKMFQKHLCCWKLIGTSRPDLWGQLQGQRILMPRGLQQWISPLPHLAFKSALLKPSLEFWFFGHKSLVSLLGPSVNLSILQTPLFQFVWSQALRFVWPHRAQKPALINTCGTYETQHATWCWRWYCFKIGMNLIIFSIFAL